MLPRIVGTIERRILLNFRAPLEVVRPMVPKSFQIRSVGGFALIGVCLIRFRSLRPAGLPAFFGLSSENAAHRISVEWDDESGHQTGVYVTRRDTDSSLITMVGGRLFPGVHRRER